MLGVRCVVFWKAKTSSNGCTGAAHIQDFLEIHPYNVHVKEALFDSKLIKNYSLFGKVYILLCEDQLDKVLSMVLFSP